LETHFNTYTYTYAFSYSYAHCYAYAHSISYSRAQSDSHASPQATASPEASAVKEAWRICFLSTRQSQNDMKQAQMKRALIALLAFFVVGSAFDQSLLIVLGLGPV
jgi:hypothetical protein